MCRFLSAWGGGGGQCLGPPRCLFKGHWYISPILCQRHHVPFYSPKGTEQGTRLAPDPQAGWRAVSGGRSLNVSLQRPRGLPDDV